MYGALGLHGAYVPEGVTWSMVDGNLHHHRVWLWIKKPGRQRRTRVLLGDIRRHKLSGRASRYWRAFPTGDPEFPDLFSNHYLAMAYLKTRWENRNLRPAPGSVHRAARRPRPSAGTEAWVQFFGEDPFADMVDDRK